MSQYTPEGLSMGAIERFSSKSMKFTQHGAFHSWHYSRICRREGEYVFSARSSFPEFGLFFA